MNNFLHHIPRLQRRPRFPPLAQTRYLHNVKPSTPFKILFLGRDEFSCLVLEQLYAARDVWQGIWIATHADERTGRRGSHISVAPLKILGHSLKLRTQFIPSKGREFNRWLPPLPFAHEPDPSHLLITASFGRLISDPLLHAFLPCRRLNVHPSLLPAFRGPAPIQRALMHGIASNDNPRGDAIDHRDESRSVVLEKTGVCVIEMRDKRQGADTGDIWGCKEVPIPSDAFFAPLRDTLGREGGELLVQVLRDMLAGTATCESQANIPDAPYAPLITLETAIVKFTEMTADDIVRLYRAIGHQRALTAFINPTSTSLQLHEPNVYVPPHSSKQQILLQTQSAMPKAEGDAIFSPQAHTLLIRCANDTYLSVPKVKAEGKRLVSARDWWNGVWGGGRRLRQPLDELGIVKLA